MMDIITLKKFLREQVAKRTRLSLDKIDDKANLLELGLQSIDAVIISGELEERFDIEVEPVLLFDKKSIEETSKYLHEKFSC